MVRSACPLAVVLGTALVSGCATTPPPPPATVSFTRTDCSAAPDLAAAVGLTPPKEKAVYSVISVLDGKGTCLSRDGMSTPYVVYALPADHEDKTVTVGALLEGVRLVSPGVAILDARGGVTRTFASPDFFFRGPVYSVLFRPRPEEAYVLVTADPSRVGQRYDSIAIGIGTAYVGNGGSWNFGVDASQSRVFSYEGSVQVTVNDSDTKEKPLAER